MENRKEFDDVEAVEEQDNLQVNSVDENSQVAEENVQVSEVNEDTTQETVEATESAVVTEENNTASESSEREGKKKLVARKDMTWRQWTWHEMKRNKIAYVMIAPFMFVFILFTVFPVVLSLVLSFTNFNMLNLDWDIFVGVRNYTRLFFEDDIFLLACKNTLVFAMITGPVSYILSFLVAWFINELSPRIRALVTLVFYAPSISGNIYFLSKLFIFFKEQNLVSFFTGRYCSHHSGSTAANNDYFTHFLPSSVNN